MADAAALSVLVFSGESCHNLASSVHGTHSVEITGISKSGSSLFSSSRDENYAPYLSRLTGCIWSRGESCRPRSQRSTEG